MAQFDVYAGVGRAKGYVVALQADLLERLAVRVVAPMVPSDGAIAISGLTPRIRFQEADYLLLTYQLALSWRVSCNAPSAPFLLIRMRSSGPSISCSLACEHRGRPLIPPEHRKSPSRDPEPRAGTRPGHGGESPYHRPSGPAM
jgi:hypothetical protein